MPRKHSVFLLTSIFALIMHCSFSQGSLIHGSEPDRYQGAAEPRTGAEIYGQGVRETPWLSPADEAKGFHLPPGFSAELVASEPQISKPLNMAFDHRGRLWVTCTIEYPYAVAEGKPSRDTIRILEDTDGNGSFDKVTVFADQLNIPIGIIPVPEGAICFSIPNIWLLKDTNHDDKVDERVKLLGPFDTTRDTHGMINALRQGSDGWIYACHGFNNRSNVTAADGSKVEMNSGNTFRFKADGSRIEQVTTGQVNPFGMCCDQWGNWFTADCHSKPLTALLPGACYPSFGRPHDGLGFAPSMMEHLHGSTAICGVEYYQAENFPPQYGNLFYSGNVMTSRINCNAVVRHGATIQAQEMTDFMTSEDPWYRPVDVIGGPDGTLYVADFYNKIIGHYEVPLTHPERDRESGRIWRIRYTGSSTNDKATAATKNDPLSKLASKNYQQRRLAIEAEVQVPTLKQASLEQIALDSKKDAALRQSATELLNRRNQLPPTLIARVLQQPCTPELQVQLLKTACGWSKLPADAKQVFDLATKLIDDQNPEVAKAAIETLGRWGNGSHVDLLVKRTMACPADDPVMLQANRIALRNILQRNDSLVEQLSKRWQSDVIWGSSPDAVLLVNVLPGVPSSAAAEALLGYVASRGENVDAAIRTAAIEHAARHPDEKLLSLLLKIVEQTTKNDPMLRAAQVVQITGAYPPATKNKSVELRKLAEQTVGDLMTLIESKIAGEGASMQWIDNTGKPWNLEPRKCTDGQAIELLSSLTRGEQYVGQLMSESFSCPDQLRFWIAGHNGHPDEPDHRKNYVAMVQSKSGQVLAQAFPPRNDTAKEVTWDLKQYSGQDVRIRIVDGDAGSAYAWLGVSRFSLPSLQVGTTAKPLESVVSLLKLGYVSSAVSGNQFGKLSERQRAAVIAALLEGRGELLAATLTNQALTLGRTDLVKENVYQDKLTTESALPVVTELCRSATGGQQSALAQALLKSENGCELLAESLEKGLLNPASLRGAPTLLPAGLSSERKEQLKKYFSAAEAAGLDTSLVTKRLNEMNWADADIARGKQAFTQHCANCHQLAGQGATIGPQLDGAVQRSVERISEDLLLPNLNVDKAFRTTTFLLADGSIVSGMIKEENDQTIQVVGSDAKTKSISVADIEQRKESELSLMPANFSELLTDQQLADLLQFLNQSAKR